VDLVREQLWEGSVAGSVEAEGFGGKLAHPRGSPDDGTIGSHESLDDRSVLPA
jgi:hypothetical protein